MPNNPSVLRESRINLFSIENILEDKPANEIKNYRNRDLTIRDLNSNPDLFHIFFTTTLTKKVIFKLQRAVIHFIRDPIVIELATVDRFVICHLISFTYLLDWITFLFTTLMIPLYTRWEVQLACSFVTLFPFVMPNVHCLWFQLCFLLTAKKRYLKKVSMENAKFMGNLLVWSIVLVSFLWYTTLVDKSIVVYRIFGLQALIKIIQNLLISAVEGDRIQRATANIESKYTKELNNIS